MELIALQLFLLSIVASFVQRTTGFGFGIFITTMLPALMPSYGEATTLSGILAMTTSAIIVVQKYKFNWPRLLPILLMFIIVSFGAIFVLKQMEYGILSILLGITLVIVSIYFAFFSKRIKVKTTMPVQVTAGALSGVMGGFFGMQGLVTDRDEQVRAMRAICERFLPEHMDAFEASIERSLHRTVVVRITLSDLPTGKRKQYDKNGNEMKYGRME